MLRSILPRGISRTFITHTIKRTMASDTITLPSPADFHTHLRQDSIMRLVSPHVLEGGCHLAYVMPNTTPTISTVEKAKSYHSELTPLMPNVHLMMTLYLSPELTPEEIRKAKESGIVAGVKSYPRGVTTNSDSGVESYEQYFPVFAEMERQGLVLNLHGEVPSNPKNGTCVLNAEPRFLKQLTMLHENFPKLRIVLEHATTKEAVETVKSLGDTVACSITAHHLALTVDDWAGQNLHFCKPVAKTFDDRQALREVIASGHPRFFLGSDSAPHPLTKKLPTSCESPGCAAGIYTSSRLIPLVATLFEAFEPVIPLERLSGFVSDFGRKFYNVPADPARTITLKKRPADAKPDMTIYKFQIDNEGNTDSVVPFWHDKPLAWELQN